MSGIYDITPFSALDYPDNLSAIVWFNGCNIRCRYCHNLEIVEVSSSIKEDEVLEFLKHRKTLLDGVVLSGGEATLYKNLKSFCKKIKMLGFKIKLDTNGTNPTVLMELLDSGLLDFVAVDFKALDEKYTYITQSKNYYKENIASVKIAISSSIEYQIRSTYHSELTSPDELKKIEELILSFGAKRESIIFQKYKKPNKYENELEASLEYEIM
ncbi:MAG: anaerobic ribonucleoside-triphosphate reductase activating protein [Campylobacterales bacterium]